MIRFLEKDKTNLIEKEPDKGNGNGRNMMHPWRKEVKNVEITPSKKRKKFEDDTPMSKKLMLLKEPTNVTEEGSKERKEKNSQV